MKIHLVCGASIVSLAVLLGGCSKQEEQTAPAVTQKPPTPAPPAPPAETPKAVSDAVAEAKPAAAAANEAAKTADTVKSTESAAAAGASAQVGAWFDKIKGLINEKKYTEALTALSQPPPVNLTAEQQKLVEQLKTQVESALAKQSTDEGVKAVGGLLNKK
jgi:PBP1b-binding outer membrane lipoprotein LpoB